MSHKHDRRKLVSTLAGSAPDALFVTGLGSPSWDLAASGDSDRYFYLWGGMGQAVMVALGIALARPDDRVIAITGDGEMLMGMTGLTAIGAKGPRNLGILVLDNETYGETGGQASATRGHVDLVGMAKACSIDNAAIHQNNKDLAALASEPGPVLRVAKIERQDHPLVVPPRDGALLKDRFRQARNLP